MRGIVHHSGRNTSPLRSVTGVTGPGVLNFAPMNAKEKKELADATAELRRCWSERDWAALDAANRRVSAADRAAADGPALRAAKRKAGDAAAAELAAATAELRRCWSERDWPALDAANRRMSAAQRAAKGA